MFLEGEHARRARLARPLCYHVMQYWQRGEQVTREHQVQLFLAQVRAYAPGRFLLRSRHKNRDALALLGIGRREVLEAVLEPRVSDYVAGPVPNLDRADEEVWVFGIRQWDAEMYVKLVVLLDHEACICISFHPSERPLTYPFETPVERR
jgi:hypothetical protein